ncbi:nucleotidyltransferase domain-containing protein [uncultured Deinococcus sp.]|uniref:nucleotidyltransferase domain-containing protein n=1 Tax=uncultured Deinococcus sp. TaxID=158789 RepID=UPI0025ECB695|nr:nucleotidyltransferase domain-containing protein [uncultured Deinococcus sp.]
MTPDHRLPIGTHVTLRTAHEEKPVGTAGIILRQPSGDGPSVYAVQFPDGAVLEVNRVHLAVRRSELEALPESDTDLWPYVQYRCVMGSRAFGLDTDASDTDLRGFFLPPARLHWGLADLPEQLERHAETTEEVSWEARKFVRLALKANPNVLECLYSPLPLTVTEQAQALLDIRGAFLSRLLYQTYNGYVQGQFRRLEQGRRAHGDIRPKHVMHLLRLLLSGIHALRTGEIMVNVGEHKGMLLAVKSGQMDWAEANRWRLELHAEFDRAFERTRLPERPDFETVEAWLIAARRAAVDGSG